MVFINGEQFNSEEFHNGEVILKGVSAINSPENKDMDVVEMMFHDNKDIAALQFARQYLKDKHPNKPCKLEMLYCPYERMDREINEQLFSLKYFAEIIGAMNFSEVHVLDPHSKVLEEQFEAAGINLVCEDLNEYIKIVLEQFKPDYICYPDAGASKKYPSILTCTNGIQHFFGEKKRDLANKGKIESIKLVDAPDLKGKRVLIIDDICCLGGTAYNVAKEMKRAGADNVAFYISHCERGVYVGHLLHEEEEDGELKGKKVIDTIYTANTMGIPILDASIIEVIPE